jgi:hypothetical protein
MTEACPLAAAATAAAGRKRSRRDYPVKVMPHLQGSSAMLSVSPSAAVAGTGHYPADPARLMSLPAEPGRLDSFRAAVAGFTGLDAASPRTAEIASAVLAGLMAAMIIEGSSAQDAAAPRLRDQAAPYPGEAAPYPGEAALYPGEKAAHRNERLNSTHLTLARPAMLPVEGQVCAVFAVDIVGFTRPDRDDDIRLYLHQQLYEYLRAAFDDAGVPWAECFCEDRGDGALVVIPPEISAKGLIDPLPEKLRGFIRRHNHVSSAAAQLQLRAALNIGPLEHDRHGFVGTDVNFAFRMLESRPLKRMLAASGAELGLVVSDYVYRSLVCRYPSRVRPGAFQAVRFQAKNTRARAWTYLPGTATPVNPAC